MHLIMSFLSNLGLNYGVSSFWNYFAEAVVSAGSINIGYAEGFLVIWNYLLEDVVSPGSINVFKHRIDSISL